MKKLILVSAVILTLSACKTTEPQRETIYVDKPIPFYVVPAPPEIVKPNFLYKQYTSEEKKAELKQSPGLAARVTRLSLEQYEKYTLVLELVINKYQELSIKSKKKLEELGNITSSELGPQGLGSESVTDGFISQNYEHLSDMLITDKYFDELEAQSKENIIDEAPE